MSFVKRFIKILSAKGEEAKAGRHCLIIDDSLLQKLVEK
jgi:hypothetical protein